MQPVPPIGFHIRNSAEATPPGAAPAPAPPAAPALFEPAVRTYEYDSAAGNEGVRPKGEGEVVYELSNKHLAMVDFIVANPLASKSDIAAHFGYSLAYVSLLTRSGLFRNELAKRRGVHLSEATAGIPEKVNELAHLALDRAMERIQVENDLTRVKDVMKLALEATGYLAPAGKPAASVVNNNVLVLQPVQRTVLAQAREAARQRFQPPPIEAAVESRPSDSAPPEQATG